MCIPAIGRDTTAWNQHSELNCNISLLCRVKIQNRFGTMSWKTKESYSTLNVSFRLKDLELNETLKSILLLYPLSWGWMVSVGETVFKTETYSVFVFCNHIDHLPELATFLADQLWWANFWQRYVNITFLWYNKYQYRSAQKCSL